MLHLILTPPFSPQPYGVWGEGEAEAIQKLSNEFLLWI